MKITYQGFDMSDFKNWIYNVPVQRDKAVSSQMYHLLYLGKWIN